MYSFYGIPFSFRAPAIQESQCFLSQNDVLLGRALYSAHKQKKIKGLDLTGKEAAWYTAHLGLDVQGHFLKKRMHVRWLYVKPASEKHCACAEALLA
ncbi:MAG: hypothetical protein CSA20_08350 [Deltaproteobacteria bacterium]|nr:MAG: hypothetical protein CSA20_08350 [Deltaproteobacteria bacterium]